ncbi:ArsR family transcriptional regulator [Candidatus Villigracilis proximus]|uniref:ArsR/SmtB family transcription factor n=1 Tax=Candidatus Villigracilis proximus TaxID=3140683 RepID=UPI0031F167C6
MSDEVVTFFKALADANRLKIIGLLAQQPYSVEELAALLNLKPSTVSTSSCQTCTDRTGQRKDRKLLQRLSTR